MVVSFSDFKQVRAASATQLSKECFFIWGGTFCDFCDFFDILLMVSSAVVIVVVSLAQCQSFMAKCSRVVFYFATRVPTRNFSWRISELHAGRSWLLMKDLSIPYCCTLVNEEKTVTSLFAQMNISEHLAISDRKL